jgi:hypothetical protein
MTLDEAITLIDDIGLEPSDKDLIPYLAAITLGQQAMRFLIDLRKYPEHDPKWTLPAE